jgi:hypothetical protein
MTITIFFEVILVSLMLTYIQIVKAIKIFNFNWIFVSTFGKIGQIKKW